MNTVSLEVGKKLHEAGWSSETLYYWCNEFDGANYYYTLATKEDRDSGQVNSGGGSISSPQMHEILEQLPNCLEVEGEEYWLNIEKSEEAGYATSYDSYCGIPLGNAIAGIHTSKNPHDAVALLWIWLKENGYLDDNDK